MNDDKHPQIFSVSHDTDKKYTFNRRDFLKAAGAAAAAGTLAACGSDTPVPTLAVFPTTTVASFPTLSPTDVQPTEAMATEEPVAEEPVMEEELLDPLQAACRNIQSHSNTVMALTVTPDGTLLISSALEGTIKLWSLPDGALLKTLALEGHSNWASLAVTPESKMLISAGDAIKFWGLPSGDLLKTIDEGSTDQMAITPDGRILVTTHGVAVRFWSLPTGDSLNIIAGAHEEDIYRIAISPDSRTLVTTSNDQTLKFWAIPNGDLLQSIPDTGYPSVLGMTQDGSTVILRPTGWQVQFYALPGGDEVGTFAADGAASGIASDGSLLATGSGSIVVRSIPDGDEVYRLEGHRDSIGLGYLLFSPDNRLLLSSGASDFKLWSLEGEGRLVATMPGGLMTGTSTALFTPDSRYLITSSTNQRINIWDTSSGAMLTCLIDPDILTTSAEVIQVEAEDGRTFYIPRAATIPGGVVCVCNTVALCGCVGHCSCVGYSCGCVGHRSGGTYWYPN